ncbi:MAG: hypothetical protein E7Z63_00985 [Thermoplasmata archaeon]|nr:hypothetical protein [Thermoplasmata archaeon]
MTTITVTIPVEIELMDAESYLLEYFDENGTMRQWVKASRSGRGFDDNVSALAGFIMAFASSPDMVNFVTDAVLEDNDLDDDVRPVVYEKIIHLWPDMVGEIDADELAEILSEEYDV